VDSGADGAARRPEAGCRLRVPSGRIACGCPLTGPTRGQCLNRTCIPAMPVGPSGYPARRWYPATLASHPAKNKSNGNQFGDGLRGRTLNIIWVSYPRTEKIERDILWIYTQNIHLYADKINTLQIRRAEGRRFHNCWNRVPNGFNIDLNMT